MCSLLGMMGNAAGGMKPAMLGGVTGMLAARKKRDGKDGKSGQAKANA